MPFSLIATMAGGLKLLEFDVQVVHFGRRCRRGHDDPAIRIDFEAGYGETDRLGRLEHADHVGLREGLFPPARSHKVSFGVRPAKPPDALVCSIKRTPDAEGSEKGFAPLP